MRRTWKRGRNAPLFIFPQNSGTFEKNKSKNPRYNGELWSKIVASGVASINAIKRFLKTFDVIL